MPLGLTSYTAPFEKIWPAMVELALPVTRLSVADCASGWLNTTLLPEPTEKPVQLITARALDCLTVTVLAADSTLALPAAIEDPLGNADAGAPAHAGWTPTAAARTIPNTASRRTCDSMVAQF